MKSFRRHDTVCQFQSLTPAPTLKTYTANDSNIAVIRSTSALLDCKIVQYFKIVYSTSRIKVCGRTSYFLCSSGRNFNGFISIVTDYDNCSENTCGLRKTECSLSRAGHWNLQDWKMTDWKFGWLEFGGLAFGRLEYDGLWFGGLENDGQENAGLHRIYYKNAI